MYTYDNSHTCNVISRYIIYTAEYTACNYRFVIASWLCYKCYTGTSSSSIHDMQTYLSTFALIKEAHVMRWCYLYLTRTRECIFLLSLFHSLANISMIIILYATRALFILIGSMQCMAWVIFFFKYNIIWELY